MSANPPLRPIIVKKPKRQHHQHHGGAWKVAYADFVTAMMAFFLVMWLVGQSKSVKGAIGEYFRDPGIFDHERSTGAIPGGEVGLETAAPPTVVRTERAALTSQDSRRALENVASRIREALGRVPEFKALRDQIEVQLTPDGLRIELIERSNPTFFDTGSDELKPATEAILAAIARELGTLASGVVLEGHTDSRQYAGTDGYTNWELSADRANAARRVMELRGLRRGQVRGVRGYADTQLRVPDDAYDPRNRRVSIIVPIGHEAAAGTEREPASP